MTSELVGLNGSVIALEPSKLPKPKLGLSANEVISKLNFTGPTRFENSSMRRSLLGVCGLQTTLLSFLKLKPGLMLNMALKAVLKSRSPFSPLLVDVPSRSPIGGSDVRSPMRINLIPRNS